METRPDRSSTYFVQDRSNQEELARVTIQDQMITQEMGGVLPEQEHLENVERVLDVACGTGGWLIETAKAYPHIQTLIGVDISKTMLEYARARAQAEGVADRVEFISMDALLILEFPHNYFDLVNHRLGISYLRKWDWPKLLDEFQRVTRPGGIVRLTESNIGESNSPALTRLSELFQNALFQAGNLFEDARDGLTRELPKLMERFGFQHVQRKEHVIEYRPGTPAWQSGYEDGARLFRTIRPFLQKRGHVPPDYDLLYQQMLKEMQDPGFVGHWTFVTIWGTNPPKSGGRADLSDLR